MLYKSGDKIKYNGSYVKITTDANGNGNTSSVLPAGYRYYVQEYKASTGYTLDSTKYYFKIVVNSDGSVSTYECNSSGTTTNSTKNSSSNRLGVKEKQIYGYVAVTKYKETDANGTTALEKGAVFYVVKRSAILSYFNTSSESVATAKLSAMSESGRQAVITSTGYVRKLTTNASGYAKSGYLPYGRYYLIQTDGDDACELVSPKVFSVSSGSGSTTSYTFTNKRKTAGINITKSMTEYDSNGEFSSVQEEGAVFAVLYASKISKTLDELSAMTADERQAYVDSLDASAIAVSLTTDENGEASAKLDAGTTYIVLQTDGANGYALTDAEEVTLEADQTYFATYTKSNPKYQHYFEITKTLEDANGRDEGGEEGAEFALVLESALDVDISDITDMTAEERANYVSSLDEGSVISTLTTDADGYASLYWSDLDYDGEFVVIQTKGTDGYALMPVISSADATDTGSDTAMKKTVSGDHDELTSYSFSYTDSFTEWARLAVQKVYQTGNGTWDNEEGAEFTVTNTLGEVVAKVVTDASGYGMAMEVDDDGNITTEQAALPIGTYYYVTQTATGANAGNTELTDTEAVAIVKGDRQTVVLYEAKNEAKDLKVTLTKLSDDTGSPVEGATYAIVAAGNILDSDGVTVKYAKGTTVAEIVTDENGEAWTWLPYGSYYAEETASPSTFVTNTEKIYFTLDENGITIDGQTTAATLVTETSEDEVDDNGYPVVTATYYTVGFTTYDTPVYGSICITKDGEVLTGADYDSGSFTYTSRSLAGAVYALYAREDIYNDAGELVWEAGEYITSAETDSTGSAQFFWDKDGDGVAECADFYLGEYYVVETYAPDGYVLDTEEHDIGLTWDTTPLTENDYSDAGSAVTTGEATGSAIDYESSGEYVLMTGEALNALISDAKTVTFTWSSPASGTTTTDVSHDGDGTVVMWDDGDGNYYISTCDTRQAVIFNGDSSYMFYMCTSLTEITFDAVDTSKVIDMSYMFYMCTSLTELDLTNFDTTNVSYTDYMFAFCSNLVTIYVTEPGTGTSDYVYSEETFTTGITAQASGTFVDGDEITWEDFTFTRLYSADYIVEDVTEDITLSASDIASISPSVASQDDGSVVWVDEYTYTMEVEITLDESCEYYCTDGSYSNTITVLITVELERDLDVTTQEHATAELALSDTLITVEIQVIKQDTDGNDLEGAEFVLYANCDIEDADGNLLYSAGDAITSGTTIGETAPVLSFGNLPTDMYAVAGTYLAEAANAVYCYANGSTGSTADGDSMFYIVETKVPSGYELEDTTWYLTGALSDYAEYVKASDTSGEGIITYTFTAVNTPLTYLTLEKAWDDSDDSSQRPDYVVFLAASDDGSTYVIALYEDIAYLFDYTTGIGLAVYNGTYDPETYASVALCSWDVYSYTEKSGNNGITVWNVVLDESFTLIGGDSSFTSPFTEDSGYTFAENTTLLESMTTDSETGLYYQIEYEGWTNTDQIVWRTTNYIPSDYTSASVLKVWDDNEDEKGIRPDAIYVTLWQEDSQGNVKTYSTRTTGIKLSEDNDWYYSTDYNDNLPVEDNYGGEYTYYWTENTDNSTVSEENTPPDGYAATGSCAYDDVNETWYTEITNTTEITVPVTVTKVWNDDDDASKIRPDTIYVQLYANNVLVDVNGDTVTADTTADTAVALTSQDGWTATLDELPKYTSSGTEITYKFKEVTSAATLIVGGSTVTVAAEDVSWYTGDADTGYKTSYSYAIGDTGTAIKNTAITNTHTPTGEITIEKTVSADDVIYYANAHDGEDPEFTFTLADSTGNTQDITLTFDTSNVTNMIEMFCGCSDLQTIYVGDGWTTDAVADSTDMFANCSTSLVGGNGTAWNSTNVTDKTNAVIDTDDTQGYLTGTVSNTVTLSTTITGLSYGTYTVTENIPPDGWVLTALTADGGTANLENREATFVLDSNNVSGTLTASYTNSYEPEGTITVTKTISEEELETYRTKYGTDPSVTFTLYDENDDEAGEQTVTFTDDFVAKDGYVTESAVFESVALGKYTLAETDMPDEWDFVEIGSVTNGNVDTAAGTTAEFELTKENALQIFAAVFTDEYPTGEITVTKKVLAEEVEAYNADAEFTFTLYNVSTGEKVEVESQTMTIALADCTGLASGTYVTASATFTGVEYGEYALYETDMPADWEFVEIESVTNGTSMTDSNNSEYAYFYLTADTYTQAFEAVFVDEYSRGSITVIKYGNDGKTKLDSVTFTLYDENGEVVATKTTGENGEETGQVAFTDLKKGTYILTETSTVDGYSLLADEITITLPLVVTADEIDAYAAAGIVVDTTDAISKGDEYWFYDLTYTVTDSAVLSLPSTGNGLVWFALALIVGGLVLANVCAFSMRLKRIRMEERQSEE